MIKVKVLSASLFFKGHKYEKDSIVTVDDCRAIRDLIDYKHLTLIEEPKPVTKPVPKPVVKPIEKIDKEE